MVRDLGMAKQRLVAIQNYLMTLAPHLHSPSIPAEHFLRPCVASSSFFHLCQDSFPHFSDSVPLPYSTEFLNQAPRRCFAWKAESWVSGWAGHIFLPEKLSYKWLYVLKVCLRFFREKPLLLLKAWKTSDLVHPLGNTSCAFRAVIRATGSKAATCAKWEERLGLPVPLRKGSLSLRCFMDRTSWYDII